MHALATRDNKVSSVFAVRLSMSSMAYAKQATAASLLTGLFGDDHRRSES
jgi:hypothetical protein